VQGVDKVIGVTKLRKNYRQYKDRRDLLSTYDLFLADDRITSMLPALIGKKVLFSILAHTHSCTHKYRCTIITHTHTRTHTHTQFFEKKKHPSPVNLKRPDIAGELTRARDSTYFHLPAGSTCMVKVALTSFDPEKVAENVLSCLEAVVDHIPKKWKNIQALYLRTSDSVALPFYYSLPSAPQDATAAPATADASAAADATPAVMEDDVDAAATATGKKRKRAATAAPAVKSPEAKPTTSKPDAKAPSAKKAKAATSTQPAAPKSPAATKNVKKDAASTPVASATKPAPTGTPKAAKTPKAAPKAMIDTPRPTKTSKTTPKTATDKPAKKSTKKAAK
jgi:hypothetical protein